MISFISLPAKIIGLLEGNISPKEVASGVCLGMFLGFIPLNGPFTIILILFFFCFKLNRVSTLLVLPLFKLLYVFGVSALADNVGTILLIKSGWLFPFWRVITHLPVIALLDINNTLVAGGLAISFILCFPLFMISEKYISILQAKYGVKLTNLRFVKWLKRLPMIEKINNLINRE